MNIITGGVCAPLGFSASGVHCGVKANSNPEKQDLAMILSNCPCTTAATYTLNRVKAAPLYITMNHLENGTARGIIVNSGNANACCPHSKENATLMCVSAAEATGLTPQDFVVASTGVIGQTINIEAIQEGVSPLVASLTTDDNGSRLASAAIMTTDLAPKEIAIQLDLGGKLVTMGAIAKGSGMIHPNMGTMLGFVTTDCAISHSLLQQALSEVVKRTFNRVTVDGDTSTNDMCVVLANGMAKNLTITEKGENYNAFKDALEFICRELSRKIAADGEGASKLITCQVQGGQNEETAELLAKSVVGSSLVKTAMFGADANWGRVLCALGYSGVAFDPENVDIAFASTIGTIAVCAKGEGLLFDEDGATKILSEKEVIIQITLHEGFGNATCWGCDLTYDYVKINGDYRS